MERLFIIKTLKYLAHCLFRTCGYDFLRYTPDNFVSLRRAKMLRTQNVDLVLDVGANEGTYPIELRQCGYKKRIISFEPLSQSFSLLQQRSAGDPLWDCKNMAIGDSNGTIEINISGHKTSSSILPITEAHIQAMPTSAVVGKEKVKIAKLDSLLGKLFERNENIYLKIDVQGYEKHVLQGAEKVLRQTHVIELELSLTPMYESGTLMYEMLDYLAGIGFNLVSLEPAFIDPKKGIMLQVDGIFVKHSESISSDKAEHCFVKRP